MSDVTERLQRLVDQEYAKPHIAAPDSGKSYYSDTNYQILGALVETIIEQTEEWHLTRRYMSQESLSRVLQPDRTNPLLEEKGVA